MQVFNCHSLGWFCIAPSVQLTLTGVVLCHSSCPTATNWGSSMLSLLSHCNSLEWLCINSGVLLPLTGVALFLPCCFIVALSGGFTFKLFQHHSLEWLSIVLGISLLLVDIALCPPGVSQLLTQVDFQCFRCPTVTHSCSLTSSQVFHCPPMRLLWVMSDVPLPLTNMALCHFKCHSATNLGGSLLTQVFYSFSIRWLFVLSVFYCHSLGWFSVIACVSLLFTGVVLHLLYFPTVFQSSDSVSSWVFHHHS